MRVPGSVGSGISKQGVFSRDFGENALG